jgi:Arc/MetJ-type ribon-helix-helix transcriptional regulator
MVESNKTGQNGTAGHPLGRAPISAVKLPADLTAHVDAWASVHAITRSEAIRRLVELGLKSEAVAKAAHDTRHDAAALEDLAASQLNQFIDPTTPPEERERRIHRLTEGPPEFVDARIDLPKRGQ